MRGDEQDTIDERIDAALRRYAEAPQFSEPRVALARVRALAEQEPQRRWNSWTWVVPSSVMAVLIAVVVLWMLRVPRTPQIARVPRAPGVADTAPQGLKPAPSAARNGTTEVVPFQNTARSSRDSNRCCGGRRGAIRAVAQEETRALPKQEVFPTPQPLSPQERALVSFVSEAPPAVKEQVLAAQKQIDAPIEIADIHIEPLDQSSGEPQTKGKDLP